MSNPRYPEELKIQAVNQAAEKKLPVADVTARLVSACQRIASMPGYSSTANLKKNGSRTMISTLNCVVCERNSSASLKSQTYQKRGRRVLCQGVRLKYAFIKQRAGDYSIRRLCLTLKVHPSGYYAWLSEPQSARAKDDQRLLDLNKHSWLESGGVYAIAKSMTICARSVRIVVGIVWRG